VYDVAADQWSTKAPEPKEIILRACITIGDVVRVFGGYDRSEPRARASDRVDVYDPLADSWSSDTRLPTARHSASASLIGNDVFVFGGRSDSIVGRTSSGGVIIEWHQADALEILNLEVLADDAVP
jgi:N-acetylneuraminic acid mutarotase